MRLRNLHAAIHVVPTTSAMRLRRLALATVLVTAVAAPVGCMSTGRQQSLTADNRILMEANDKLTAAVEQYEVDATAFEQQIFELEDRIDALATHDAALRSEAGDLLDRVHTLEAASISLYVDRQTLSEVAVDQNRDAGDDAGLLTALAEEIEAGRVHVRLVPRTADGHLDTDQLAATIPVKPLSDFGSTSAVTAIAGTGTPVAPAPSLPSVSSQAPTIEAPAADQR
jgi:hypothetical protein